MTKEDDDYRQGRRKEQMKATYIGAFIVIFKSPFNTSIYEYI